MPLHFSAGRRRRSGNQSARSPLIPKKPEMSVAERGATTMSVDAEELITRNLIEALDRLHEDLDRVELWTAALGCFAHPAPEYEPGEQYMLPPLGQPGPQRAGR